MSPSELETVSAEVVRLHLRGVADLAGHRVDVRVLVDELARSLTVQLVDHLAKAVRARETVRRSVRVPDGWWQGVKERWRLLRWRPVRYRDIPTETVVVEERLCPHVAAHLPPNSHQVCIRFLTGRP